jgi:peptidoglycan/LPS O-acetylase OafA/YrhL
MPAPPGSNELPEAASLLLDLLRFSAALAVVVVHLGAPEFQAGFRERHWLGQLAVALFFVLSGFVIRWVTVTRERQPHRYLAARVSKIYSVALPALLLTVLAGLCSHAVNPAYFNSHFAATSSHAAFRILVNLAFLAQSWGLTVNPIANFPFWSLSYECMYYALYGLVFFLRGRRRIAATLLWFLLAGPQVLLLLPAWAIGCLVYELYARLHPSRLAARWSTVFLLAIVSAFVVAHTVRPQYQHQFLAVYSRLASLPNPLALLHLDPHRATLDLALDAFLCAPLMLALLLASQGVHLPRATRSARTVRFIADGTFAIYLMHYPLLLLASSFGLLRPHQDARNLLVAAAICLLLIAIAAPLERFRAFLRIHTLRAAEAIAARRRPPASALA